MSELSDPNAEVREDRPSGGVSPAAAPRPTSSSVRPHGAIDWSRLTLAAGTLVAVCGSVFLGLWLFSLPAPELEAFLANNKLDAADRSRVLVQLFAALAAPLVLVGLVVARFRGDGVHWLARAAARVSPLVITCFVPTLLSFRQWYADPLPYLVLLVGAVLLLERLFWHAQVGSQTVSLEPRPAAVAGVPDEPAPSSSRAARYVPLGIVIAAALGYAVHASYYTIVRHRLLGTAGFDLGIFDNLMFNAMHLRPFRSTVAIPDGSYLSNHAEYGMFLFVPLYWLRPGADTLLVLQSAFIGFAAVPLYFFAATQLSRPFAAALACVYLFYAPLHGPNYYDFHWMPQSMLFFFWLFHAIVTGKRLAVALLTVVICSIREDAAFGVIATGLFLVMTGFRARLGAVLTAVATAWFVLVKFVIMPWAGPWWFADIYKALVAPGESGYGSVVKTILTNPNYFLKQLLNEPKAIYALHLLAPLAFLPVRHPALWVLMLPGFFVTLMTTGYPPTISIAFQYTTHWIPFLFGAAAIALGLRRVRLGRAAARASVLALCFGVLCHSYVFGAILQHETFVGGFSKVDFTMSEKEEQRYRDLRSLVAKIPPEASVAATELIIPHVSTRLDAYTLKVSTGNADYVLVSRYQLDEEARRRLREAFMAEDYGLLAQQAEFYLFRKGHESPETAKAMSVLGMHRAKERPKHHDSGSLIGPGGNCVSYDPKRPELFVRSCAKEPKPRWMWALETGKLQYQANPELCLGVPKLQNFEPLRALPCSQEGTSWTFEEAAIHNYSEKCVDLLGGNPNAGAEIGVWSCVENKNQKWSVTRRGEVRLGKLSGSKCWTVRGDAPGTPLELHPCDGSPSQRFTFGGNRIRHGDKCLDVRAEHAPQPTAPAPELPSNGFRLQLWPCEDGRLVQEFHFSGPISHRGKCVDSMYSQTSDGSVVGAWDCIGNTNQVFDYHF